MDYFHMDAHMHFDLYKNRESVLSYIESNQSYTIAMTNLPELFEKYYIRYTGYIYTRIALGFHPELVNEYKEQLPVFFKNLSKVRYIGEVGLDFTNRDEASKKIQKKIFSEIVAACNKAGDKILSVHSRRAEKECVEILKNFNGKIILHWYSGNKTILKSAVEMGCYFSINHQMLLSENGKNIIKIIPLNRILIESDSPFTMRTETTYSLFFVDIIYEFLSKKNNMTKLEISRIVRNNFKELIS